MEKVRNENETLKKEREQFQLEEKMKVSYLYLFSLPGILKFKMNLIATDLIKVFEQYLDMDLNRQL